MNIIVPIGGQGKRFYTDGYHQPKPLIKSLGESIVVRSLNSLSTNNDTDIIYITYRDELEKHNFEDLIKFNVKKNIVFKKISVDTRGAAETVLITLENIPNERRNQKTIIVDSDNVYLDDVISKSKEIDGNVIFYFEDTQIDPIFSYITIEDGEVTNIKEKQKISNNASLGVYGFSDVDTLEQNIVKTIKGEKKENNEFYMSSVYKTMLEDNIKIKSEKIDKFICLGTPDQLKIHSNNLTLSDKKLRICFDIDNTLVTYPEIEGDYSTVKPIQTTIDYLKTLKSLGHTIILYTARRMKTHKGNVASVIKDIGRVTFDKLDEFGIPYDEIYFGKPYANYYIDDLAVNPYGNMEQDLGIYITHPNPRSHNNIEQTKSHIKKCSTDISGERYWYENIPNNIRGLFPIYYNGNNECIEISKINGIPISYLNTSKTLNEKTILKILTSLTQIHNSQNCDNQNFDVSDNYLVKLLNRLKTYKLDNVDDEILELTDFFSSYIKDQKYKIGVIHGDPVFTNILIDNYDDIKFIDMRGKVGDTLTIFGDIFYDFSKVYQSIIGYDFLLSNKEIDKDYIENNKKIFIEYITINFGVEYVSHIKNITKCLILSLIPIHKNESFLHLLKTI